LRCLFLSASARTDATSHPTGHDPRAHRQAWADVPVGHSADAPAIHAATGVFVNPDPVHLQSTGFVLDPDGTVIVSVYCSGAIDRLVPEDVAGLVRSK